MFILCFILCCILFTIFIIFIPSIFAFSFSLIEKIDDSNLNSILQDILEVVILFMTVLFIGCIIRVIFTIGGI